MELKKYNDYIVAYQRQGNDRNGNPVYIINIFKEYESGYIINSNLLTKKKLDKYGSIKTISYNIDDTINSIINSLETE